MNTESKRPRLLFLDNIKILFALLVIFQHARITYGGTGGWFYIEGGENDLFSYIFFQSLTSIGGLFQSSLMGLFFLMGAFFTPRSYDRKGLSTFWKERLLRLGIPLLLYILLINPILYSIVDILENPQGSFLDYYLNHLTSLVTGPMWFLLGLLIFTFLYTLWRQTTKYDSLKQYIPEDLSIPKYYYLLLIAIILGCFTFLFRLISPVDSFPLGFPFGFFPQYLMMFSVGIIATRYDWFEKMSNDHVKVWAITIAATFVAFFAYFFIFLGIDADFSVLLGGFTLPSLIFSLVDNIICMGMIFVLIPIFYKRFNYQGTLLKKLSASSFNMYLIHAPILVAVTLVFASIPLFPAIKLAIVFPLTVILCYLASHFVLQKIL
ncbi:MAG: acyltransferase family protein [Candidatus Hodarchaeales archaeon]